MYDLIVINFCELENKDVSSGTAMGAQGWRLNNFVHMPAVIDQTTSNIFIGNFATAAPKLRPAKPGHTDSISII